MKNTIILLCFLLCGLTRSYGQDFYYYRDKKITLKEDYSKVFVKFAKNTTITAYDRIIRSVSELDVKPKNIFMPEYGLQVLELNKNNSEEIIKRLLLNEEVICSSRMYYPNESKSLIAINDEIVLQFHNPDKIQNKQWLESRNFKILKESKRIPGKYRISIGKSTESLRITNNLYEEGLFRYCEPNFVHFNMLNTNDPLYSSQWCLKNTGQGGGVSGEDINVEQAWAITWGRPEIKIAVIDNGIDLDHPDLAANLLPGYDATGTSTGGGFYTSDEDHGSACAGIIGAIADNNLGIAGVAPKCKMIPIKGIVHEAGYFDDLAEGMEWAVDNGADVISNSYGGGGPSTVMDDAVEYALSYGRNGLGCVVVFASGNDNASSVNYPSNLPGVISVGAFRRNGERSDYSNYGSQLSVVAPGGEDGYNPDITTCNNNGDYRSDFNGTSAACPHVSGAAGLVLSVNPCLTSADVKKIIELSADNVGETYCPTTNGVRNDKFGHGKLDVTNAVRLAMNYDRRIELSSLTFTPLTSSSVIVPMINVCGIASANYIGTIYEASVTINAGTNPTGAYWMLTNGYNASYSINSATGTVTLKVRTVYVEYAINGASIGQWYPTIPSNVQLWAAPYNSGEIYLQNKTENNLTQTYRSPTQIFAGRSVTSLVSQGDYVLNTQNDVKFIAKNKVVLQPGFYCTTGNKFNARIGGYNVCADYPQGLERPESTNDTTLSKPILSKVANQKISSFLDEIELYPNPVKDELHIDFPYEIPATVTILSVDGRFIKSINLVDQANAISVKSLTSGTYYLKITNSKSTVIKKIVKID